VQAGAVMRYASPATAAGRLRVLQVVTSKSGACKLTQRARERATAEAGRRNVRVVIYGMVTEQRGIIYASLPSHRCGYSVAVLVERLMCLCPSCYISENVSVCAGQCHGVRRCCNARPVRRLQLAPTALFTSRAVFRYMAIIRPAVAGCAIVVHATELHGGTGGRGNTLMPA